MSALRRILTAAVLTLATAGALAAGTTSQALAATPPAVALVQVTGTMTLVDDDYDYDPTKTVPINQVFTLTPGGEKDVVIRPSGACAGGEVRATVNLKLGYRQYSNEVSVNSTYVQFNGYGGYSPAALQMFEGASCSSNDLDGIADIPGGGFNLVPTAYANFTMSTWNTAEGSGDRATVNLKVTRIQ